MQPAAPPSPPEPPPAAQAAAPRVLVNLNGTQVQVPTTREELRGLRERRSMLSDQLGAVKERRDKTAEEMRGAVPGQDFIGLEGRLKLLDARLLEIETDISQNSAAIAAAPPSLLASSSSTAPAPSGPPIPPWMDEDVIVPTVAITSLFVFFPIAMAYARRIWRRPIAPPALSPDLLQRFDRMEQAIDSIAVEVERVSEGQRFVTQVMSESRALGAGPAPQFAAKVGDPVPVKSAAS
jgi:hypothetical protein